MLSKESLRRNLPSVSRAAAEHGDDTRYSRIAQLMIDPQVRHDLISQAAYFRAQRRAFAPGHELDDWLAAQQEVDTALTIGVPLG
jgi:hypothetical protein